MKKNYFLALISMMSLVLMLAFTSCDKPEPEPDPQSSPELILDKMEVSMPAEGGEAIIKYTVNNPIEGAKVEVKPSSEAWISGYTAENGEIKFIVAANEGDAAREAVFSVKYAEIVKEVKVKQAMKDQPEPTELTFKVEFTDITETTATFNVIPSNDDDTYLILSIEKTFYDEMGNDDTVIDAIMTLVEDIADQNGMTVEQVLATPGFLDNGPAMDVIFEDFRPGTDYYILVLGVDEKGNVTSDLHAEKFTTKEVEKIEVSFEIVAEVNGPDAIVTVTPSDDEVLYYYDMVTGTMLENDFGGDAEALVNEMMQSMIDLGALLGMDLKDVLAIMCYRGEMVSDFTGRLSAETEYVPFAAAVDENSGAIVSDVVTAPFTTGPVAPSDNVITLTITNVNADRVIFSTTTTNEDPYAVLALSKAEVEGMTDDEISDYIKTNFNLSQNTTEGSKENIVYSGLQPNTEYYLMAFGYQAGCPNTDLFKAEFTTLEIGDPTKFTYTAEVTKLKARSARVDITPDPNNVMYYFDICEEGYTAEEIRTDLEQTIQDYIDYGIIDNALEYFQDKCSMGPDGYDYQSLYPETAYQIYAFAINATDGSFATDVMMGEVFTTPEVVPSDATVTVDHTKYFDADAMNDKFGGYDDVAGQNLYCQPMKVSYTGEVEKTYVAAFTGALDEYGDEDLIFNLVDLGKGDTRTQMDYFLPYDTDVTIVAVAEDVDGNFSKCFRELINKSKDGASPVDEYEDYVATAANRSFRNIMKASIFEALQYKSEKMHAPIQVSAPVVESIVIQTVPAAKEELKGLRDIDLTKSPVPATKEIKGKITLRTK